MAMERDILGWRARIGIVAPATNTIVQPEMEGFRPVGVTNHIGRIAVRNTPIVSDADFLRLLDQLSEDMDRALDDVAACKPDHLVIGVTSPMVRGGLETCVAQLDRIAQRTGIGATAGSMALGRVLKGLGIGRIGLITPYQPVMDMMLTDFMGEVGVSVARLVTLRCPTPFAIAQVTEVDLRARIAEADMPEIEAWVQVGTNLAFSGLANDLSAQMGKPVVGVNAATYWEVMRVLGVTEELPDLGPILATLPL
jgi:maleate isomerase